MPPIAPIPLAPYTPGDRVNHLVFEQGTVLSFTKDAGVFGDEITISFDKFGVKTLSYGFATALSSLVGGKGVQPHELDPEPRRKEFRGSPEIAATLRAERKARKAAAFEKRKPK